MSQRLIDYTEDERDIIISTFSAGSEIHLIDYPKSFIEATLKKFLNNCIETDGELDWVFSGDKAKNIYKYVSESFIREYWDYITDWEKFWTYFNASENFIDECPIKNWYVISKWQNLSEKFIWENRDRVDWDKVCQRQILSKEFCYKHREYMNWDAIIECQDSYWMEEISDELKKKLYYS